MNLQRSPTPLELWMLNWFILAWGWGADVEAPLSRSNAAEPVTYVVLVTGGELLEGAYPDAHTHFITRTLRPLGCQCVGSMVVDDRAEDIQAALRFATNRARLVVVTGGLGPTPNDITRETLSAFTGIRLEESAEVIAGMERRFGQSRDQLRPNLRRQALVPVRGGYLKNPAGTAVGLIYEASPSLLIALPGPPRELQPMVRDELVPFLQKRFGVRPFGCSITLRFVGAGQSQIDQTIKDHVSLAPDITITSAFDGSRVDFTFSLPRDSGADLDRLKRLETAILEHLGEYCYADDGTSLEEVVLWRFRDRSTRLVLAETGTAGHLATALGGADSAPGVLAGAWVASTETALSRLMSAEAPATGHGSQELVTGLAQAAAQRVPSSWALATGSVTDDPAKGKGLWAVLRAPDGQTEAWWVTVREGPEISRAGLVTQVLDRLRRKLVR